jgi:cytochrome c peroxidase
MTWTVAPELKSQVRIIPSNLGQQLFEGQAGCVECHPPPNYTNGKKMDTGRGTGETCMVPSLAEVWRSAPYLHDAAAPTLMEVITDFNPDQKRGRTKDISKDDLWQLVRYVESLTRP